MIRVIEFIILAGCIAVATWVIYKAIDNNKDIK